MAYKPMIIMKKAFIKKGTWGTTKREPGELDVEKFIRDELYEMKVPSFQECCPDASVGQPVRMSEGLEYFDGEDWVSIALNEGTGEFSSIGNDGDAVAFTDKISTDEGIGNVTGLGHLVPFISISTQTNITAGTGGAIPLTSYLTTINSDAGGDSFTLADGTIVGQLKKILLVVDGGGDAVITPTNLVAATTITLDDATDYVILIWGGTDWYVIENSGGVVA